jgi:glycosyltransferase involved in cell wall biosynthesis
VARLPVSRNPGVIRILAEHLYIPALGRRADVAVSLDYLLPLFPIGADRTSVVVQDVLPLQQKQGVYPVETNVLRHRYYCLAIEATIKAANLLIANSQFTASEIAAIFPAASGRISVVPLGIDHERFRPLCASAEIDRVREVYSLPDQFYLFVGSLSLNKNLRTIVDSYASGYLAKQWMLPVVVVGASRKGNKGNATLELMDQKGVASYFHFLGYLPDADLPALYAAARALIHPAWHEGFGFPPLEAMACGTPVVASNQAAIPEVVGDSALLVDPGSTESLAQALERVNEGGLRRQLIERGIKRAAKYSWQQTAEMTAAAVCDASPASA